MESSVGLGYAGCFHRNERFNLRGSFQVGRLAENNEHRFIACIYAAFYDSRHYERLSIWLSKVQMANQNRSYLHRIFRICVHITEPIANRI